MDGAKNSDDARISKLAGVYPEEHVLIMKHRASAVTGLDLDYAGKNRSVSTKTKHIS